MKKPLLIYGAGGLGREVLSLARVLDEWDCIGFIDDVVPKGTLIHGLKVIGGADALRSFKSASLALAFGDPASKKRLAGSIGHHVEFPALVHPRAVVQDVGSVRVGKGSIITAGAILTCDISIGDHVLVNINATVGHDVRIGDFSSVMPGVNIAGEVTVGQAVLIGSGSNILNRITIGDGAKVGMGSVVIGDVGAGVTVVGVPAKPIKR